MRTFLPGAACAVLASAIAVLAPAAAEAAQPDQVCRTHSDAILCTSPSSGILVPQGSLVRILDYRGLAGIVVARVSRVPHPTPETAAPTPVGAREL